MGFRRGRGKGGELAEPVGGAADPRLHLSGRWSGRPWKDGDLLGIAYAWEQVAKLRRPPVLVEEGLLPITPARTR